MPTRNTLKVKELIYGILSGDATLESLLGGTDRVIQASPNNLSQYPLVAYTFPGTEDNPFESDLPDNATRISLLIECFSADSDTEQVDAIEDRVFALLHGQRLSNAFVQVYSINRVSRIRVNEPDINVNKVESMYTFYNATI